MRLDPRHVKRYADLVRLMAKYGRSDLVDSAGLGKVLTGSDAPEVVESSDSAATAQALAADIEALGPTYIKLGQLLSTRADLLPPPYLEALSRLQDEVEPVDTATIKSALEGEFDAPAEDLFTRFDDQPMAAASIGQVHRAQLPDGTAVAVKIQRPGIRDQITHDLDVLAEVASLLDDHTELGHLYGLGALAEEFGSSLLRELDYRAEASNLVTMATDLEPFSRLVVPRPAAEFCTSKVLTMELLEGQKLTQTDTVTGGAELAAQLFEAYLQQILANGFVHADPHPGNVLLLGGPRIGLVDLGMVARLDRSERLELIKLMVAISEERGDQASRVLRSLGTELDGFDDQAFEAGVSDLIGRHAQASLDDVGAGTVFLQLMQLSGTARLRPPAELALVGKALLNLDDVCRRLDADFVPLDSMRRVGADIVRRELTPTADAGWAQSLIEARELATTLPSQVRTVLDSLAEGELTVKVDAIEEDVLARSFEKVANRLTMGLLLAAMVIGAAMTMRVETDARLWGYPAVSIVFFLLAGLGSTVLMVSIAVADRRRRNSPPSG